jgi:predicted permease
MNWRRFFHRARRDAESARDIQFYLDTETDENVARGMSPEEARRAARKKFGNDTLIREEIYRMNSAVFLEALWQDILYALRAMRNSPTFAATAAITLALGIGGNTAAFTVIRAVLLRPLEFHDPDQLVYFSVADPRRNAVDNSFTLAQFEDMRATAKSFAGLGAYGRPENVALSGNGGPEALKGARVSANFLDILGKQPLLGRSFLPEEDRRGGPPVAMISRGLWQRRFGSDPSVAGRTATLDSTAYTIIGVLPDGFEFPFAGVDVWLTRPSEWSLLPPRYWGIAILNGFGRLKPQVSLDQARAEMRALYQRYAADNPSPLVNPDATMRVVLLEDRLVGGVRPMLWTLFGAVGFVLLIGCANVASLLLARATSRTREFALRAALGAGRWRLIRQLLAESLVLAIAGGLGGALLAKLGLRAIAQMTTLLAPSSANALYLPGLRAIELDGAIFGFTLALSVLTGILFGLFPSLQVSRPNLADALRESGAGAGRASARRAFGVSPRGLLVIGQVAFSMILLIGAALLIQSFVRLRGIDTGFQPANLLTMKIALPPLRYDTPQKRAAFFQELVPRVEAAPSVSAAAIALSLPTTNWIRTNITDVEGRPAPDPADPSSFAVLQSVTPGYFRTLGIPLKRGREFTERDNTSGAPPVMIVNESLARRLWPDYPNGANPVGLHVKEAYDKAAGWMEVVGVVADIREGGLARGAVQEFYLPSIVHPPQTAYLAVRTAAEPMSLAHTVRSQVAAVDRDQPVSEIRTMDAIFDATLGQRRLMMILLGSFAGVALLLALVGIYGVIAYSVAQRTHEMGIRRALGAQQADVLRLVLRQGLALALTGGALGIFGAFALTRLLKSFLFDVTTTDPMTFAGVALLLIIVALAASFIPARRAARIDPMAALRIG